MPAPPLTPQVGTPRERANISDVVKPNIPEVKPDGASALRAAGNLRADDEGVTTRRERDEMDAAEAKVIIYRRRATRNVSTS